MKKRVGVILILLFAFCGLADSAYLAQHEVTNTPLLCNIANLSGCNIVAQSPYSHLFGIPIAVYGILFYAIVFVLAALELVVFDRLLRRVLQGLAVAGIVCSLYFTFLQVFVIGALCIYCIGSAVIAVLILISASVIEPLRSTAFSAIPPEPPSPPLQMPPAA
jgi:uncharacterized membrane protein